MTAIITIAIILALFLGVAIVIAMRKHYAAERLRLKVKSLNAKIQGIVAQLTIALHYTALSASTM